MMLTWLKLQAQRPLDFEGRRAMDRVAVAIESCGTDAAAWTIVVLVNLLGRNGVDVHFPWETS